MNDVEHCADWLAGMFLKFLQRLRGLLAVAT